MPPMRAPIAGPTGKRQNGPVATQPIAAPMPAFFHLAEASVLPPVAVTQPESTAASNTSDTLRFISFFPFFVEHAFITNSATFSWFPTGELWVT
jgi:hypothetical protein